MVRERLAVRQARQVVDGGHPGELLFVELLGVLDEAEVITLERVMHDGTKIRAQAGVDTFRREKTLAEREAAARELLHELGDPEGQREGRSRKEAAQERARRERAWGQVAAPCLG